MKPPIETAAIFTGLTSKVDRSLSLRFTTPEVTPEIAAVYFNYLQTSGYLLFSPNQFSEKDIPDKDAPDDGKSPATRLRNVLYVLYKQKCEDGSDFESYYRSQMERMIEHFKAKLLP